jgi:hypothetical protein
MTKQELIDCLKDNLGTPFTKILANETLASPNLLNLLIEIAESGQYPQDWRAAWVIDHIWQMDKQLVEAHIPHFANNITTVKSNGVKRHYLKIVSQGPIEFLEDGNLVGLCFEWLVAEQTPIATRAHCMEVLRRMAKQYPELGNELAPILTDIAQNGSKGEQNKARKMLGELEKRQGKEI